jgi:hypothetical protein
MPCRLKAPLNVWVCLHVGVSVCLCACVYADAVPALYCDQVSLDNATTSNVVRDGEIVSTVQPVGYDVAAVRREWCRQGGACSLCAPSSPPVVLSQRPSISVV